MNSCRFAVALIAMALVATSTVKATGVYPTDLTVGSTTSGKAVGSASDTRFDYPTGVEVLTGDEVALVADFYNKRIVDVSLADGTTTEFMSTGDVNPRFLAVCDDGTGYFSTSVGVSAFSTKDSPPVPRDFFASSPDPAQMWVEGLACLKNDTHDLIFVAPYQGTVGIGAYDRLKGPPTEGDFVWQVSNAELGVERVFGLSLSPDMRHLAFAASTANMVGIVNLETNFPQMYGTGILGFQDGAADVAEFDQPYDVAWTADGHKLVVNEYNSFDFSGLRIIDFATGDVSRTANGMMPPKSVGAGVAVVKSTGEVLVTYNHGLKMMQVNGVTPGCGYVPTVRNSLGGNNATAFGFVGDTVTYVCEAGFTADGTSRITTCPSDTLIWSTVSDCQSDADIMIGMLGRLELYSATAVKSTMKTVAKAFSMSVYSSDISQVTLQKWCQQRDFQ